jgi:hypothetical protein
MSIRSRPWRPNFSAWFRAAALLLFAAGPAAAQGYERPPAYSPAAVLGAAARGANYVVLSPVDSDGAFRRYTVRTSYGDFKTTGDQLMRARIKELNALHALEKTNSAQKFGEAAVKAGLAPVIFAGSLLAHPIDTTQNTIGGVGQFFNSVGSGLNNVGKSRDDAVASISGASKQKREIATQVGVDPYTDFKPLADKLDSLAGAAAVGNLAVSGAFILTPGVAGVVASNTSGASTLTGMVNDYSSAQLMDINRAKLGKVGVDSATADQLFANPNYTPLDVTAMTNALSGMGPVTNLNAMVARAASADSRDSAYFVRRRIELMAAYQQRNQTIVSVARVDDLYYPLCLTKGGGVIGVFPIDSLSWTSETAANADAMTSEAKAAGLTGPKSLLITGTATPLAKKNLAARRWSLKENAL